MRCPPYFILVHTLMFVAAVCIPDAAASVPVCDRFGPRVDCGRMGMSQAECEAKGCCWAPAEFVGAPHVDLPWCFTSNGEPSEYRVAQVHEAHGGGVQADLELSQGTQPELGEDIPSLRLTLDAPTDRILRLRITGADQPRWEVPAWLFHPQALAGGGGGAGTARLTSMPGSRGSSAGGSGGSRRWMVDGRGRDAASSMPGGVQVTLHEEPFGIEVARAGWQRAGGNSSTGTLFNTTGTRLAFKDQYLELTTRLSPSAVLYGAGERSSRTLHLERNGMPRAIWSHDLGPTFLEQNMYGSHPVVLALEPDGSSWGMVLLSSNALDVVPTEDRLSWRVTGGIIDLFLLTGPTPLEVMDQLTRVVGRPAMMPFWSLGWHQCKYGYQSVWEVEQVVANYSAAGLPLEAIWMDIDHMDGWRDFTFHPTNYPLPEVQRLVDELHRREQRWVPIVDPGIKVDPGYPPYNQGITEDVFMRGVDGKPYLGWVWPGACHFPDFFLPRAQRYFARLLRQHRELVPWDGIWIDMDEVSNFCTGDVCELRGKPEDTVGDDPPWVCQLDCRNAAGLNATQRGWLNPPYAVSNSLQRLPLGAKSMSVLATHHDGSVEYNTHQLYGLSECRVTQQAVRDITGKRPFVLSRASYLGVGAYAAHWTGDNAATWEQLAESIPGVLAIGLWGISMAGADICGFQGDTTPELCARWVALGAFYPFARDHSDLHGSYQELYRWPEVAAAGKKALGMRYRLLPYLYTAFHSAHTSGAPVMRPLWLNFPGDSRTHTVDRQFMVGNALLVSPVLTQGASAVDAYFPPGTWHSLWESKAVVEAGGEGRTVTLQAPLGDVPLHMLGGTALFMQQEALTTAQAKRTPLTVALALPEVLSPASFAIGSSGRAAGGGPAVTSITAHMYNDGGEEPEVGDSLCHFLSVNATLTRHANMPDSGEQHSAEVILLFGSTAQLAASGSSGGSNGNRAEGVRGAACGPAPNMQLSAEHSGRFEWPELGGVDVLGWHLPVAGLTAELVRRADSCGRLAVVQRLRAAAIAVRHIAGGLRLDLTPLHHRPECPFGLRLAWNASEGGAKVSSVV